MSEVVANYSAQTVAEQNVNVLQRVAAGVILSAVAVAGCSSPAKHEARPSASPSAAAGGNQHGANTCGEIDTSKNVADTVFGSPNALFSRFYTTGDKGEHKLLDNDKAQVVIRHQIDNDERVLSVVYAYMIETRNNAQLPNTGTLGRAHDLYTQFQTDKGALAYALKETCDALPFLTSTTNFAVTRAQAMAVEATHTGAVISDFKTEVLHNATGSLQGFILGFNKDANLTQDQIDLQTKLSNLILFYEDGTIVINEIYGPSTFKFDQLSQNPVSIKINGNQQIPVKPSKAKGQVEAGGTSNSTNGGVSSGTNGTTGKTGTAAGTSPENKQGPAGGTTTGSGATPEASSGVTHNTPGGGPGPSASTRPGIGNTSPTPTPGNTPPPVVVVVPSKLPTPKPTDTFIPPPPTASPTPKGTEPPCVSNPPYVIC